LQEVLPKLSVREFQLFCADAPATKPTFIAIAKIIFFILLSPIFVVPSVAIADSDSSESS
jgi:hypothetical protein